MDTTERMMIMGMCLQGLLANPNAYDGGFTSSDPEVAARGAAAAALQRAWVVAEAHRIADLLDPPHEVTDAEQILRISLVAYEAVRAAGARNTTADWLDWDAARSSTNDVDLERVESIVERVSRWFKDPTGVSEGYRDHIVRAVTLATLADLNKT